MILGSLNMASCHYQYPEAIQKALHWLKNNDLAAMEAGTYEIEGKDETAKAGRSRIYCQRNH